MRKVRISYTTVYEPENCKTGEYVLEVSDSFFFQKGAEIYLQKNFSLAIEKLMQVTKELNGGSFIGITAIDLVN